MVPKGSTTPAGAENFLPLASARRASSAQAAALAPDVLALASASFSSLGFFACAVYKQTGFTQMSRWRRPVLHVGRYAQLSQR